MLRERERTVLLYGGIAAALIFLVSFVVLPDLGKIRSQRRVLAQVEKELVELRSMRPELARLDAEVGRRAARVRGQAGAKDSPLSRLTVAVEGAGFPQASFSLKSGGVKEGETFREEAFDLRVENRTYIEILRLLQKLENGSLPLVVRSVNLKSRYENSNYLDAVLRVGFLLPR